MIAHVTLHARQLTCKRRGMCVSGSVRSRDSAVVRAGKAPCSRGGATVCGTCCAGARAWFGYSVGDCNTFSILESRYGRTPRCTVCVLSAGRIPSGWWMPAFIVRCCDTGPMALSCRLPSCHLLFQRAPMPMLDSFCAIIGCTLSPFLSALRWLYHRLI